MKRVTGRYSIVTLLLLTTVIALSISLYQSHRWLRSTNEALSSAWETRWPDSNHVNALLINEPMEIFDYKFHDASASWRLLIPAQGTYCLRWRAGERISTNFITLPGGFSRLELNLTETTGGKMGLEIVIDGKQTSDEFELTSPLIVHPVYFSIAGMGRTYTVPPNRRFSLFALRRERPKNGDDVEIWIEPLPPTGKQQKSNKGGHR